MHAPTLIRKAVFFLQANPDLLKATPQSLFHAIYQAITFNLEIGGAKGEAYIVRYGDQAQLIISYRGMIKLVRNTGELLDVTMEAVHQGDHFKVTYGDDVQLVHEPALDDQRLRRPITHVYVIFHLRDGTKIRTIKTAEQINAHRDQFSEAFRAAERYRLAQEQRGQPIDDRRLSPWHTSWDVMAFKTLVRETCNRGRVPMSDVALELINREEPDEAVDGEVISRSDTLDAVLADMGVGPDDQVALPGPEQPQDTPRGVVSEVGQAADTQAQSQSDDTVFGGIGCETFHAKLEACSNLGEVTALMDKASEACQDDDETAYVRQHCEERATAIREARSKKTA